MVSYTTPPDLLRNAIAPGISSVENINATFYFIFQNNSPFVDDSFPPAPKSLYHNGMVPAENHVTQWLRPHQLNLSASEADSNLPWTVFRKPLPCDISQGNHPLCGVLENLMKRISCISFLANG